jgi:hypothetical protein
MIVRGIIGLEHPDLNPLFPSIPNDNTLRKHLQESYNPMLKNKIT